MMECTTVVYNLQHRYSRLRDELKAMTDQLIEKKNQYIAARDEARLAEDQFLHIYGEWYPIDIVYTYYNFLLIFFIRTNVLGMSQLLNILPLMILYYIL